MASRIAVIGIIVEEPDSVKELNQILHEYGEYIIGEWESPTDSVVLILSAWRWMHPRI